MSHRNFDDNGELIFPDARPRNPRYADKAPTRSLAVGHRVIVRLFASQDPGKRARWERRPGCVVRVVRPGSRLMVLLDGENEPRLCYWSKVTRVVEEPTS